MSIWATVGHSHVVKQQAKSKHCQAFNPMRLPPLHSSFHAALLATLCVMYLKQEWRLRTSGPWQFGKANQRQLLIVKIISSVTLAFPQRLCKAPSHIVKAWPACMVRAGSSWRRPWFARFGAPFLNLKLASWAPPAVVRGTTPY
jgi:hypothetical protein